MAASSLPGEGELRIGPLTLPAGRHVIASYGSGEPVAWATVQPVPDPGRIWATLSAARQETGLVPFLLEGLDPGSTQRPWDDGEFNDPAPIRKLDRLDAGQVLQSSWDEQMPPEGEEDNDPSTAEYVAQYAPYSRQFPGLAPAENRQLSPGQLDQVLGGLPAARIGLAPAGRPADVLPRIGWDGMANRFDTSLPAAAVLRSWEDRFGATLLQVGFAEITLLVQRPPRSLESAVRVAAEHWTICSECGNGLRDIPSIADSLVNAPTWTFWWD
jgi:Domain of unknown function (DUF4253)